MLWILLIFSRLSRCGNLLCLQNQVDVLLSVQVPLVNAIILGNLYECLHESYTSKKLGLFALHFYADIRRISLSSTTVT